MKRNGRGMIVALAMTLLIISTILLSGCARYGYGYGYDSRYAGYRNYNPYYGHQHYDNTSYHAQPYYGTNRYHDYDRYYGHYNYQQANWLGRHAYIVCPRCNTADVVPIVYGTPGPEQVAEIESGRIFDGGRTATPDSPYWYCKTCGTHF